MKIESNEIYFSKTMESAIIPTKRKEDAGYDIYAGDRTKTIVVKPNSIIKIDSGIATAYSDKYTTVFFDKSGYGSQNLKMCGGVFDSGYRGPYYINLSNLNADKYLVLSNQDDETIKESKYFNLEKEEFTNIKTDNCIDKERCIIKSINKAITQFLVLPIPEMTTKEVPYEELLKIESQRGTGWCGSSGK